MELRFVVESAGCASCGERVRTALGAFGAVRAVEIDEADDSASVRMDLSPEASYDDLSAALAAASADSGHTYRVRRGSWHEGDVRRGGGVTTP